MLAWVAPAYIFVSSLVVGLQKLVNWIITTRQDDLHAAFSPSFELQRERLEIPFVESFDFINSQSGVTQVLILDPYVAAYYSNKPYIKPFGRWGEQTVPGWSKSSLPVAQLRGLHVSHILDITYHPGGSFVLPDNPPHLTLVFQRDNQHVFRVD